MVCAMRLAPLGLAGQLSSSQLTTQPRAWGVCGAHSSAAPPSGAAVSPASTSCAPRRRPPHASCSRRRRPMPGASTMCTRMPAPSSMPRAAQQQGAGGGDEAVGCWLAERHPAHARGRSGGARTGGEDAVSHARPQRRVLNLQVPQRRTAKVHLRHVRESRREGAVVRAPLLLLLRVLLCACCTGWPGGPQQLSSAECSAPRPAGTWSHWMCTSACARRPPPAPGPAAAGAGASCGRTRPRCPGWGAAVVCGVVWQAWGVRESGDEAR